MKKHQGKIELAGRGIGVASPEVVEKRAQMLAEQDGRREINPTDRREALREVTSSGEPSAPELPSGSEDVPPWDETRDQKGSMAATVLDDESEAAAQLVEEGVDEADQDLRRAAQGSNASQLE